MTATQIYVRSDSVSILTDGASYSAEGVVFGFTSKVATFPHLNAALTANAPAFFLPLLAARIHDAFATFDELVAGIVQRVRLSVEADAQYFRQAVGGVRFILYVAGISETRGPEAYVLASETSEGFRGWCLEPIGQGIIKPASSDFMTALASIPGMTNDPDEFDPALHGLLILQEQRRRSWEIVVTGQKRHIIGGFAQLTTVTADGMSTRILQRWDDQIGELIEPIGDLPAPLTSKHQRINH